MQKYFNGYAMPPTPTLSRSFSTFSRSFSTFSGMFGPVFTYSDTFGYIRMLSAKKTITKQILIFFFFENFVKFFDVFARFLRSYEFLDVTSSFFDIFWLYIDLFGARYDPWSSSWDGVPSWDGLRERHWPAPGRSSRAGCWPSPLKY